jgi:transposase
MLKAHKIKLNPTPEQEVYFKKACGVARFCYNFFQPKPLDLMKRLAFSLSYLTLVEKVLPRGGGNMKQKDRRLLLN